MNQVNDMTANQTTLNVEEDSDSHTEANQDLFNIAPTPTTVRQTGVSLQLLKDLMIKHIYDTSVISIHKLSKSLALSGAVTEEIVHLLRQESLVELSSTLLGDGSLSFRLTDRGRNAAKDAFDRSGYLGPAPVSLDTYKTVSEHYSLSNHEVNRVDVLNLFSDFIIDERLLNQMGAAFNSQKAIFIYGAAGTGKTYTIGKMMQLFKDVCLIPYAIAVGDTIVQMFDAQIHKPIVGASDNDSLFYSQSHDARFIPCKRPVIIAGGELTSDLLEVQLDPRSKVNQAPLQLKANNGVFLIDDIGRQSIPPAAVFNRWIVPMEEGRDFLCLTNGQHFEVPFDVQLVFSSNINPLELADAAALRRIGFKIRFDPINRTAYRNIWAQEMAKQGLDCDNSVVDYVLDELHSKQEVPLLPCHPRDFLRMAKTQAIYNGDSNKITEEKLRWAWKNYFVSLEA